MADNSSFLPEDYLERKAALRTNLICLVLFGIVVAGILGVCYVDKRTDTDVQAEYQDVTQRYEEAAANLEKLDKLQERRQEMIRKAQITAVLVEKVPRTTVFAELINNMPTTLSLFELYLETEVLKTKQVYKTSLDRAKARAQKKSKEDKGEEVAFEVPETEVTIALVGIAPTDVEVSTFLASLGRSPLFNSPTMKFSEEVAIDNELMRKFRIEAQVNLEVDLEETELKVVKRGLKQDPLGDRIQINGEGQLVAPSSGDPLTQAETE